MMGPILYNSKERDFKSLGIGILTDEIETLITEERNGQFFLEMQYPTDGRLFNEIKVGRLIKANASTTLRGQQFKIIRITKHAKGTARVYAEHVSNQTAELQLKPNVEYKGTAAQALSIWQDSIVTRHDFETHSDITTEASGEWGLLEVDNARQALGGVEGSILDRYKGEFLFDNYQIYLKKNRGVDRGLIVAYGKNLIDLEQEEEIASTYTSIMPYSTFTPERVQGTGEVLEPITLTLPEYFIDSEHADKFARRKIKKVDFSEEKINDVGELRLRAQQYIRANNIGVPRVNLKVQLLDLAKTEDYKDTAHSEDIGLCDWVTVYFEDLDINQKVKVVKTVFNHTADRYKEIELGESRSNLTHAIDISLDSRFDDIYKGLNTVQASADGKNKVFRGVDEPEYGMVAGDIWYKPVNDSEHLMYIYDGTSWGEPVVDVLTNRAIDKAIEEAKKDIADAEERANEIRARADAILEGLGVNPIEMENQNIIDGILANVGERMSGIDQTVDEKTGEMNTLIFGIKENPIDNVVGYHKITQRVDLYSRTIGETEGEINSNVSRIVQSSGIIQAEVYNQTSDYGTRFIALENSFSFSIKEGKDIVSEINATPQEVRLASRKIVLDADTIVNGGFTAIGDIISGGTISGVSIRTNSGNIGGWDLEDGGLYKRTPYGYTTLKPGGDVAIGIGSPQHNHTTGAALQIWHSGRIRFGESANWIYRDTSSNLVIEAHNMLYLKPRHTVFLDGRLAPWANNTGTVGTFDYQWERMYSYGYRLANGGGVQAGSGPEDASNSTEIHSPGSLLLKTINRNIYAQGSIYPYYSSNTYYLGSSGYRWQGVYLTSQPNVSSDMRDKKLIQDIPKGLLDHLIEIKPKMYQQKGKWHFGYIAQDVERAIYKYATNTKKWTDTADLNEFVRSFAMLHKDESKLSLLYGEIAVIKEAEMQSRIDKLENKMEVLLDG